MQLEAVRQRGEGEVIAFDGSDNKELAEILERDSALLDSVAKSAGS